MTNKPIIILGNGGHASVLTETLISQSHSIIGFTSPTREKNSYGLDYIGDDSALSQFDPTQVELVLGLGTVKVSLFRKVLFEELKDLGYTFANVIHDSAIISPSVQLGEGVQIMAGAILQSNVEIQDNTIINTRTSIDHDTTIGKHVHIAPGVTISGGVHIGQACHVGTGATIIQSITIGNGSLVGAGAVVINNVDDGKKVVGVPAKEV